MIHLPLVPRIPLADQYKSSYQALLKRLDDAQDPIRIRTSQVLSSFFLKVKSWYALNKEELPKGSTTVVSGGEKGGEGGWVEVRLDDVHWESIVKGLLVHMDDMNEHVQVRYQLFIQSIQSSFSF